LPFTALAFDNKNHNEHYSICENSPFLYQRKGARGIDSKENIKGLRFKNINPRIIHGLSRSSSIPTPSAHSEPVEEFPPLPPKIPLTLPLLKGEAIILLFSF